jgi:hypothetical protein
VDCGRRHQFAGKNVTEVELTAEGGKSSGVASTPFLGFFPFHRYSMYFVKKWLPELYWRGMLRGIA